MLVHVVCKVQVVFMDLVDNVDFVDFVDFSQGLEARGTLEPADPATLRLA